MVIKSWRKRTSPLKTWISQGNCLESKFRDLSMISNISHQIISRPNDLLFLYVSYCFINVCFFRELSKKTICLNSIHTCMKGKLAGGETWREKKSPRWEMGVHWVSYILWLTLCLFQDRPGHNATRRRMKDCMCVSLCVCVFERDHFLGGLTNQMLLLIIGSHLTYCVLSVNHCPLLSLQFIKLF